MLRGYAERISQEKKLGFGQDDLLLPRRLRLRRRVNYRANLSFAAVETSKSLLISLIAFECEMCNFLDGGPECG